MNECDIFMEALQKPAAGERCAYLDEACRQDVALRKRVEVLLSVRERAGDFLQSPVAACDINLDPPLAEGPGTMIGPYKLIEQIGEGGMGLVFVAEQKQPVRRKVALKLIKPGMDSKQVIRRFEAERQALALMDHPNIAKFLDAGMTGEPSRVSDRVSPADDTRGLTPHGSPGRPYFVMELVHGIAITDYCDQARFTIRERLALFVLVCRAVQHAHTKGIIHRDLKPGNVLVTSNDGVPLPKIIDFGVAKALDQSLTERTLHTGFAQMIGTPLYMSPEQAEFNHTGVDTRSDIYSLGVLLYELLTGTTPLDKERLRQSAFDEVLRLIREEEPPRPSTCVSTLGANLETVSERRGADPRKLSEMLHGELDWIILKALDKDRSRRYETASAFAADIQRYLVDDQVEACPPSAAYRLQKFTRRNRRALLTAGIVAAVLVAATTVSTWQAIRAWEAQRQAETEKRNATTEAAIARAVNSFLQDDLLGQTADPVAPGEEFQGGRFLTVKEALDRAATQIDQRFTDQPLVEAAIRTAMGNAYLKVYEYRLAVLHLKRATSLRKAHLGDDHADTIHSMQVLAAACKWVGQFSDAVALFQQIVERNRSLLGPDDPTTLLSMRSLDQALHHAGQRDWGTSVRFQEQLLDKQRWVCGPTHPDTIDTMHNLAISYGWVDRFAESIDLHEKVLELIVFKNGKTSFCMQTFAHVCQRAGKLDQAERLLRDSLKNNQAIGDSLQIRIYDANARGFLARNLLLQERYDAAEPLVREAMAIFEKEQPDSQRRYYWVSLLGAVHIGQRKYAEAEPFLLQGYEGMKEREPLLFPNEKRRLAEVGERVVAFYELTKQPDKAHAWREKLGPKEQLKAKSNL